MSKVVTIPTYQSPFVVMVNGVKYVFPAGSVQEVPDEVAVVIEANSRKKPEEPVDAPFDCCEGGGSGGSVQSDWNQTDSSAADFIKNKPFGDMPAVILEEQELVYDAEQGGCLSEISAPINDGDQLTVVYDGETYECMATYIPQIGGIVFGNLLIFGGYDSGEPFCGVYQSDIIMLVNMDTENTENHIVKITSISTKKFSGKYLPELKFYCDSSYIYTDVQCATKATIADIPDNANFDIGLVVGVAGAWLRPIYVSAKALSLSDGYATVIVMRGSEILELHTAEYTAES